MSFIATLRNLQRPLRLASHLRAAPFSSSTMAAQNISVNDEFRGPKGPLVIPQRYLMGPGPANSDPRVLAAQSLPLLGHMHPPMFAIMDEIRGGLKYVFQSSSPYAALISGTGHAGMEASIVNLLEPGEKLLVASHGIWGVRATEMARRYGVETDVLNAPVGGTFDVAELSAHIAATKPAAVFLTQGDSSTGVLQVLEGLGEATKAAGALLIVDTVCSLGGVPFKFDDWSIDAVYSGSQKCLAAPPGAAPILLSQRAIDKIKGRATPPTSYYLDLTQIGAYWGWFDGARPYHHTGMVSNWYGIREALAIVADEGLEALWARHAAVGEELWTGLEALGLERFVTAPADRLVTVNTIAVPKGVDPVALSKFAMDRFNVEIAGGLGATAGLVWRVGLMGYNAKPANVKLVLAAFEEGLKAQGFAKAA